MRRNLLTVIALNILGLILFFSWYLPENHGFWFLFDKNIFYFFNERLIPDGFFTYLVALTNNRKFDLVAIAAMLSLMGYFFIKGDRKIKREVILIGLTMIVVAVLLNQIGRQIPVMRGSPTGYFENVNRVSELVTTIRAKDYSGDSFPGDHGLMLMIFTAFMWRYFGFRAFLVAVIIFFCFIMPRIMSGAHWFTDIAVGSLALALIGLSWILILPISDKIMKFFDRHLPFKK